MDQSLSNSLYSPRKKYCERLTFAGNQSVRTDGVVTSGFERSSYDARVWALSKRQNKMADILVDRQIIQRTLNIIPGGGGVLPYKRLIGMCRWMEAHFHDRSNSNGVAFSIDLLEWGGKFSDFWGI